VSLIQVCADAADPETLHRECRSLSEAREEHPHARMLLIHLEPLPPGAELPKEIDAVPALAWFLGHSS